MKSKPHEDLTYDNPRPTGGRMGAVAFILLLFLLTFSVLAFGTVEHWSKTVVQLTVAGGVLVCLVGLLRGGEPLLRTPGLLPLSLVLGVMFLQLVPLPISLLKLVSPKSWEVYRPVYELTGGVGWLPITVHAKATVQEFFRCGAGVLLYVLTVQTVRTGDRVKRVLGWVVGLGTVIAFVAILQQFSSDGKIYWFRPAPGGNPGGPWININQYAAYIEAICPLALALMLFYRPRGVGDNSWRERFVTFFASPRSNRHLFLWFAFVLLGFSVFVSLCRGGIITILLSMLLFAMLKTFVQRRAGRVSVWVAFCLILLAVSWFGWQPITAEFDKAIGPDWTVNDGRTTLYQDTLGIVKDFPVVGAGFGTFVDVYPAYKTILTDGVFEHAHNDYLEMLTDGGVVGFLLAGWFVVTVLGHGWRLVRKRRDRYAVLTGIGALTSIAALLMHSVVDFNLQNGAIGLYFFFLCGILVAAVNSRYGYYETLSLLAQRGSGQSLVLGGFALLFFGAAAVVQFGILNAGHRFNGVKSVYITSHLDPAIMQRVVDEVTAAGTWDPLEAYYPFYHGNLAVLREGREAAAAQFRTAALLRPLEGVYLQRVGLMLPPGEKETAMKLMAEAYRRALLKNKLVASWVEWLLVNDQRPQAAALIKEWFVRDPAQATYLIPLMTTYRFTRDETAAVLPPTAEAWIRFGKYKQDMGQVEEAGYYRSQALAFIDREAEINPKWFTQLISYYQSQNMADQALAVLRKAVEQCPDHAPFHVMLGDYYRKENITYRALEEYQKAVALEPDNETYRRRLRKLELDIEFPK